MPDHTQDADFMAAPSSQQHAYLMSVDQDYAKAPPEDQQAYLHHLATSYTPPAPTATLPDALRPDTPEEAAGTAALHGPSGLQRTIQKVQTGDYPGAAHEVISSAAAGMSPLLVPAAAAAPIATGVGLGAGLLGGYGGKTVAQHYGASPGAQDLAGDVGAAAGGAAGGAVGSLGDAIGSRILRPEVGKAVLHDALAKVTSPRTASAVMGDPAPYEPYKPNVTMPKFTPGDTGTPETGRSGVGVDLQKGRITRAPASYVEPKAAAPEPYKPYRPGPSARVNQGSPSGTAGVPDYGPARTPRFTPSPVPSPPVEPAPEPYAPYKPGPSAKLNRFTPSSEPGTGGQSYATGGANPRSPVSPIGTPIRSPSGETPFIYSREAGPEANVTYESVRGPANPNGPDTLTQDAIQGRKGAFTEHVRRGGKGLVLPRPTIGRK